MAFFFHSSGTKISTSVEVDSYMFSLRTVLNSHVSFGAGSTWGAGSQREKEFGRERLMERGKGRKEEREKENEQEIKDI